MKNESPPSSADILQYTLRPGQYCNVDGSVEIGWGLMCACFGISSYVTLLAPSPTVWWHGVQWLFFVCGALGPLLAPKIIKRLLTFPRTGYVAYQKGKAFWLTIVTSVVIGAAVSVWVARHVTLAMRGATVARPASAAPVVGVTPGQLLALFVLICLTAGVFVIYLVERARQKGRPAGGAAELPPSVAAVLIKWGQELGALQFWFRGGKLQRRTTTSVKILILFYGIMLLLAAPILGLIYLSELVAHPGAASFTRMELLALFVPCNAILYLMMVASGLKEHAWKLPWCGLLVFGSLAVGVFLPANFIGGSRPLLLFLGMVWLGSGLATLFSYLRRAPVPDAAEASLA